MTNTELAQDLAGLHKDLIKYWLTAGPETVLELLDSLSRQELTDLLMAEIGASLQ